MILKVQPLISEHARRLSLYKEKLIKYKKPFKTKLKKEYKLGKKENEVIKPMSS